MKLVDVHCHLNQERIRKDLEGVLSRAKKAGLKAIICSGTNPAANRDVLKLAKKDSMLKVSLGLHPIDALGLSEGETGIVKQIGPVDLDKEFAFMEQNKDKMVAVGEVGLDFHWDSDHHQEQIEVFKKIIHLAIKIKKPLIVHTWEAEEECLNLLEEEVKGEIPVVLHCFGGRKSLMTRGKELGYYFTIPPSILRIGNFQTLVKKVDLKQLLTETDSPWQSPFKGKLNEPAKVIETIKKIAHIKKISEKGVANQIWENYEKVFG